MSINNAETKAIQTALYLQGASLSLNALNERRAAVAKVRVLLVVALLKIKR